MEFRILGPLEVAEGDRPLPVGGAKERALLAILLIHAGEVVSADRLIDELWGSDLPANPSNALQVVVSRLRRALEGAPALHRPGALLVTRKPGYVLEVDPEALDARRFERLVEEARQLTATDQLRASSLLGEALGLWRGPALAEFAFEDFAQAEVAQLQEARLQAVELKMEADLALGRHAELVGELQALVAGNPLRERLRGQLMLALYRSERQGEALRVFQEGRKALVEELGIDPGPELQELHQQILLQAASLAVAPQAAAAPPHNNLPAQVTSFVGRDLELREVKKALQRSRLVTLTGAGGCGKTRLALEAAGELLEAFPDGVWLVEREAVSDPALVPQSLGSALGVREDVALGAGRPAPQPVMDKLIHYLGGKQLLVVLDNCEHLVEACAQVAERVLRSAPRVRILATSRERLGVGGEVLWPVPPLGLPASEETSPEQLAQHDAVRLFVDRATAVQPSFILDAEAAPAVHHICRRLDGMPLALELAAARVRVLPTPEIAARLEDRFSLLVSGGRRALPRHQTLRAAIDWSYELLSQPERERGSASCRCSLAVSRWRRPRRYAGARGWSGRRCWSCCRALSTSPWSSPMPGTGPGSGCWRHCAATPPSALPNPARRRRCNAGTPPTCSGWRSGPSRCSAAPNKRSGYVGWKPSTIISAPLSTGHSTKIQSWPFASPAPWRTSG
jgi:DNA-binding SARP family transcriptional activator